jgi:hypothetical protein
MAFAIRIRTWLRYARQHPWQAIGLLMFAAIPIAIFHLFERQVEAWEDEFLETHGTTVITSAVVVIVDFMARHPLWSILLVALGTLLGLLVHAYVATHPFHEFERLNDATLGGLPAVDFRLIPQRVSPDTLPRLMLIITNRGYGPIEQVRMRATEYRIINRTKIMSMQNPANDSFSIETIPGKGRSEEIGDILEMPYLLFENIELVTRDRSTQLIEERYYALRFSFLHAESQKRYCHYKVIQCVWPYLLVTDFFHVNTVLARTQHERIPCRSRSMRENRESTNENLNYSSIF